MTELLAGSPLFAGLDRADLSLLAAAAEVLRYEPGQVVFREGDPGHHLYLIASGEVEVTTRSADRALPLTRLGAGGHFGEQALLPNSGGFRNADVSVVRPTVVARIGADCFRPVVAGDPELARRLRREGDRQLARKWAQRSALLGPLRLGEGDDWLREESFRDGEVVIREGEAADRFYTVVSGTARVTRRSEGGERLLARVGADHFFGEIALLKGGVRTATVRAEGPLRVISASGARFLAVCETHPDLREMLATVSGFHRLAEGDLMTMHQGTLMGLPAMSVVYHRPRGVALVFTRATTEPVCALSVPRPADGAESLVHEGADGRRRELLVRDGRVQAMTCIGPWADLPRVFALIRHGDRLRRRQRALFGVRGELWLRPEPVSGADREVICRCTGVTRGELAALVREGCGGMAELATRSGASLVCGGCTPRLAEIAARDDAVPARVRAVIDHGAGIKSFRLVPEEGGVRPARPGQHVRVAVPVAGRWQSRPYTLTSTPADPYYEVTVKRMAQGRVSGLLHDRLRPETPVRVSAPQGRFHLPDDGAPVVFFAGGIGITPALAMARRVAAGLASGRLHVDYSARSRDEMVGADELVGLAARHPAISVTLRESARDGRIDAAQVAKVVRERSEAWFLLCGPDGFQDAVRAALTGGGVGPERIRSERFVPAEGRPATLQRTRGLVAVGMLAALAVAALYVGSVTLGGRGFEAGFTAGYFPDAGRWKPISGGVLAGLLGAGLALSLRRRAGLPRLGRYGAWRLAHGGIGILAVGALAWHSALTLGANVSAALSLLLAGLAATGAAGAVLVNAADRGGSGAARLKRWADRAHVGLLWPMPAAIALHVWSVYYF